jgi:hypothetical protein
MTANVSLDEARDVAGFPASTRLHGYGGIVRWGALVCLFAFCLAVRPVASIYFEDMAEPLPKLLAMAWLVNLLVALPVLPIVALAERRTAGMAAWPRNAVLVAAVILATLLGVSLRAVFGSLVPGAGSIAKGGIETVIGYWMDRTLLCSGLAAIYVIHSRMHELADAAHAEEITQQRLSRQGTEAALQSLHAQIEPHFLFNTLANARRLLRSDPAAGRAMLRYFQRHLRTSLTLTRARLIRVADAFELTEAYLQIQAVRMGARLRWHIEGDAAARDGLLPPMMLITLVENAIKHGLGPLPDGGTLDISAQVDNGRLKLRVSDDGAGFRQSSGGGTGLANVRNRLGLMYGEAGQLRLSRNTPRGVVATLSLPYQAGSPE